MGFKCFGIVGNLWPFADWVEKVDVQPLAMVVCAKANCVVYTAAL